jgi:anhydro-N-acetylmuramic acid kinase
MSSSSSSSASKLYIGLMSGTSMDGVDAALISMTQAKEASDDHGDPNDFYLQVIDALDFDWPRDIHARLIELVHGEQQGHCDLGQLCQLRVDVANVFADAALSLAERNDLIDVETKRIVNVEAIGSHGQTVYHVPAVDASRQWHTPSTFQLDCGAVIAARTGCTVVSQFRCADMAHGGCGAPLIVFADRFLWRQARSKQAIANSVPLHNADGDVGTLLCESAVIMQNIGGIANATVLFDDDNNVLAFDQGPGNMLADLIVQRLVDDTDDAFDRDGAISARGTVVRPLLDEALRHPYFAQAPPKATGAELFGQRFFVAFVGSEHARDARPCDLVATAIELTAHAIVDSYRRFVAPKLSTATTATTLAALSGGGALNRTLRARLDALAVEWQVPVRFVDSSVLLGVDAQSKEAVGFALLAFARLHKFAANVPQCTGASRSVLLGSIDSL